MLEHFTKQGPLRGLLGLGGGIGDFLTIKAAAGASGGDDTIPCGSNTVHTFLTSDTFEVTGTLQCTILCVGGGGGGGPQGGAGGAPVSQVTRTLEAGTYQIVIGAGGADRTPGSITSFGAGTAYEVLNNGGTCAPGARNTGGSNASGYYGGDTPESINVNPAGGGNDYGGHVGGTVPSPMAAFYRNSAGSGATENGTNGSTGPGGDGVLSSLDCNDYFYGGGGGGGCRIYTGTAGTGGAGGGGGGSSTPGPSGGGTGGQGNTQGRNAGQPGGNNTPGGAGGINTGGGGGGAGSGAGGQGGSGIVIISYPT